MKTFVLELRDTVRYERIEDVVSFTGEDAAGGFGILAGHARMMTVLDFGLARFKTCDRIWQYLAMPGAILYFNHNTLQLISRRYVRSTDYREISTALQETLLDEETALHDLKTTLKNLEENMLQRMYRLGGKKYTTPGDRQ